MIDMSVIEDLVYYPFWKHMSPSQNQTLLVDSVRMGCGYPEEGFEISRDSQYPFFTLHILFSGCTLFRINKKEYLTQKGDAFIITAGTEHSYSNYNNSRVGFLWIELSGKGCKEILSYFQINNIYKIEAEFTAKITDQLIKILTYVKEHSTPNMFELSAMQYTLIMYMLEAGSVQPKHMAPPLLELVINYINDHFTEQIQIQKLAKKLSVSQTYLTRQFKLHMGTSPYQYITLKKIEYACHLLEVTSMTCTQIAEQTGFYDATHFHRTFVKVMKITPMKYRGIS